MSHINTVHRMMQGAIKINSGMALVPGLEPIHRKHASAHFPIVVGFHAQAICNLLRLLDRMRSGRVERAFVYYVPFVVVHVGGSFWVGG